MPPIQYRSQIIEHLGLGAGLRKGLGIAEHIDKRAPKIPDNWDITKP